MSDAAARCAPMVTRGPAFGNEIGTRQREPLCRAGPDPDGYRAVPAAHASAVVATMPPDPERDAHTVWLAQRNDSR